MAAVSLEPLDSVLFILYPSHKKVIKVQVLQNFSGYFGQPLSFFQVEHSEVCFESDCCSIIKLLINSKIRYMKESSNQHKLKRGKSPSGSLDQQYLNNIKSLNDNVIFEATKQKDCHSAISLLNQLELFIKNGHYGTYTSSKKQYYYHLFVCYYNMALVQQEAAENNKARQYMDKAIQNYQKVQGFITNREENLVFMGELAKVLLQYCGLLSHCNMHEQSAVLAEKALDRVIQSARILQAVCYEQALFNAQRQTTCSSRQKGTHRQYVDFKSIVIDEAENILKELSHLSPVHKLISEDKRYFQSIMTKIFAWKQNQENNEAMIKKSLKIAPQKSSRSILGLQKMVINNEFQIGTFMTLTFKNIVYSPHPDPLRLLSTHYLKQLAFYSAVAYFTMATETRFSQSDLSEMRGSMKIDQKYHKLNHDERLLKCKILHLKALEVAGKLLPSGSAIFGHFVQSFCRNYKFVMDQIGQVSELNSTHMVEKPNIVRQQASIESEYGFKATPNQRSDRNNTKLDKTKTKRNQRKSQRSKSSQTKKRSQSVKKKNH